MALALGLQSRWHLGLLLLAIVITLWVASGFFVNALGPEYPKPFFITYINTSTFMLYLIPTAIAFTNGEPVGRNRLKPDCDSEYGGTDSPPPEPPVPLTFKETSILGAQFSILWFLANCTNNAAYIYTSVSSATILACTSSFFTLLAGVYTGVEVFSTRKLLALIVSILGISCIAYADRADENEVPNALLGNLLALASAAFYGLYTTLLKVRVQDESRLDSMLFFGFVGFWNTILSWPFIILLHYSGAEVFSWPRTLHTWALLAVNVVSIVIADYLWVLAMLMTTPLVVTVGLAGSIPLSMIGDMIINARIGSVLYLVGAGLVCWSFVAVNREEQHDQREQEAQ